MQTIRQTIDDDAADISIFGLRLKTWLFLYHPSSSPSEIHPRLESSKHILSVWLHAVDTRQNLNRISTIWIVDRHFAPQIILSLTSLFPPA